MKRLMDIKGAMLGLLFIAFLAPFIALAIILESGLPVLVRLNRVSAGKIIKIYKFRSMKKGAEKEKAFLAPLNERKDSPFFKSRDDPRITKVGRFLRRTRLDEFPQLINVLKGELSLVGPRPHEVEELLKYPAGYQFLFFEKSGVTGLSQITAAPYLAFKKELELDLYYSQKKSLSLDFKIILKTIYILLRRHDGI